MSVRKVLKAFGFTVRRLRKARGLSPEELGFAAGLDRSYVGGIERGERNVSLVNLERLAKALSLSLTEMFREHEHGPIAITEDSPFPISYATTDSGMGGDGRCSIHVASEIAFAALSV
ncbi:MAG: helix-turn-helix transcriptional regulator [Acidobacteria bacterium]|nr:helix-turn-helix transcriptional regulator [Acidobacteriota bacterium]